VSLYVVVLWLHSTLRWFLLLAVLSTITFAIRGLCSGAAFGANKRRLLRGTVGLFDLQFLLGLSLYVWLSPIPKLALADFAAAMKSSVLRFFSVEHPTSMLLALVAIHVTAVSVKLARDDRHRHRRVVVGLGLAMFGVLVGIPWPFLPYGRALFRLG